MPGDARCASRHIAWNGTMTHALITDAQALSIEVGPRGPLLQIEPEHFLPRFNVRSCYVKHRLAEHPLLTLPRLLDLARWLPPKYVRINSGNVRVNATPAEIPGTGLSLEQSFERL